MIHSPNHDLERRICRVTSPTIYRICKSTISNTTSEYSIYNQASQSSLSAVQNIVKALITRGKYDFSLVTEHSPDIVIEKPRTFLAGTICEEEGSYITKS